MMDDLGAILERHRKWNANSDDLKLYVVENTAGRQIEVLARSADCAKLFALSVRHVQAESNAKVRTYRQSWWTENTGRAGAMRRAMKSGKPGVVEWVDKHVIIKAHGKVYAPIGAASSVE